MWNIAEPLASKNELTELLAYLTPQEIEELDALLTTDDIANQPYWSPFPDSPQERAYHCTADVIGYGGAAGGGKSYLLLGKAFTQFKRAYIFRRYFTDLTNLVEQGNDILDGVSTFVWGIKKHWELPDRVVRLRAADQPKDLRKYKGAPKDFIGIDEADEFTQQDIETLMGWLRTEDPDQHTQVVLCFNPPGVEGQWLIEYFAPWLDEQHGNPAEPGELRWFARVDGKDVEIDEADLPQYPHAKSRTFFRASVEDNPVYMATGYDRQLESLPEPLRSQLRYGDFTVGAQDDDWQVIPTAWVVEAQNRYLKGQRPAVALRSMGVDPSRGGDDETSIAKLYGTWFETINHPGVSVPDGAAGARYITDALGTENAPVFIDVIGYGASVYDHVKVLGGITAHPVNVGAGSHAKDKTGRYQFFNLRAELLWKFREALDPASGENIALPPSRKLRADLCAARYSIVSGKIKVEPKEDIKKRLGRSPDEGEAVLLAWHAVNVGTG